MLARSCAASSNSGGLATHVRTAPHVYGHSMSMCLQLLRQYNRCAVTVDKARCMPNSRRGTIRISWLQT